MSLIIREGTAGDYQAVVDNCNYYIRNTFIHFSTEPETVGSLSGWFAHFDEKGRYRLMVAYDGERFAGFAATTPFHERAAYETSVHVAVYLDPAACGKGVGTRLYQALFEALDGQDVHRVYAGIAVPNDASERLHKRFGFEKVGHYHEVGRKFGRYIDVKWYEKVM